MVRGRKPKPTSVKELTGNPGKRRLNPSEPRAPMPDDGRLQPPPWLASDPETVAVWNRIVPVMVGMGVASLADIDAIGRYCDGVVKWDRARSFLQKNGSTYPIRAKDPVRKKLPDGTETTEHPVTSIAQFPQVAEYRNLSRLLLNYEAEFGMTASARSRIQIGAPRAPVAASPEEDEAARKRDYFASGGRVAG